MKTKLITTHSDYWLEVDEEVENFSKNELCLYINGSGQSTPNYTIDIWIPNSSGAKYKLLGHFPKGNAPKLEGINLLPQLPNDEENVEQLALKEWKIKTPNLSMNPLFLDGYKAAKQSEKKYSEEELRIAMKFSARVGETYSGEQLGFVAINSEIEKYLQSLSTTTPIDFEVEMEYCENCGGDGIYIDGDNNRLDCNIYSIHTETKPKVINGVLQGKWIFKTK